MKLKGKLYERGTVYTFFRIGGVNDRHITLILPLLYGKQHATLATMLNVYAPTMTNPEETKDKCYEDLQADKLIILGDFRVGSDYTTCDGVIGRLVYVTVAAL